MAILILFPISGQAMCLHKQVAYHSTEVMSDDAFYKYPSHKHIVQGQVILLT